MPKDRSSQGVQSWNVEVTEREESGSDPLARARRLTAPPRLKRFYAKAEMTAGDGGFALRLDGKQAMTPGRRPLVVPHAGLAAAIGAEWAKQQDFIEPVSMPVTRLANTAIDGVAMRTADVQADIAAYAASDLLYYRASEPEGLVERERGAWDPILAWAETRFRVRFVLAEGIVHVTQPPKTIAALNAALAAYHDPFVLAGLSLAVTLTGSALIALALAEGAIDADAAWAAAHIDEDWNISKWGEDAGAMRRLARRFDDFRAAALALRP